MNPALVEIGKMSLKYAAIPAGIALMAGTHTLVYKVGVAVGHKRGEKCGYKRASAVYEQKYQELKGRFERNFSFL